MKERMDELVPKTAPTAYIHPTAVVSCAVTLGDNVSVWPCAVLRGDIAEIVVGKTAIFKTMPACMSITIVLPLSAAE